MTDDKDFKRLVRARMAKTGESYTAARARLRPPAGTTRPTPSTVEAFRREIYTRTGTEKLGSHLESRYGIGVKGLDELDLGVFHVTRTDGPDWVARVFPKARGVAAVEGDAQILRWLAEQNFPAERCAHNEPVSELDGQGALVTGYVPGPTGRLPSIHLLHRLGDFLGQLHTMSADTGAMAQEAGSWHHLAVQGGGRREDVTTLMPLLADARQRLSPDEHGSYDSLCEALVTLDHCDDLPHAFTHPQLTGADVVESPAGPVIIDWAGAGRGPRVTALANLIDGGLYPHPGMPATGDLSVVDAIVAGYRQHVRLDADELSRLAGAMEGFKLILDCWYFLFQDVPLEQILKRWPARHARAEAAAARAIAAFEPGDDALEAWDPDRSPDRTDHEDQGTLW